MSLYNMMCGMNPAAGRLLQAINLDPETIPRFRDVWINTEFTEITVHTRTGGGNRDEYATDNDAMTKHPLYLRDRDDPFDSTFADFTFRLTEEERTKMQTELEGVFAEHPEMKDRILAAITETPRAKFDKAMEALCGVKSTVDRQR